MRACLHACECRMHRISRGGQPKRSHAAWCAVPCLISAEQLSPLAPLSIRANEQSRCCGVWYLPVPGGPSCPLDAGVSLFGDRRRTDHKCSFQLCIDSPLPPSSTSPPFPTTSVPTPMLLATRRQRPEPYKDAQRRGVGSWRCIPAWSEMMVAPVCSATPLRR